MKFRTAWFHVAKHLGEAVDRVRRAENKALRAEGDDRLKGTKYDWLRNPENFTKEGWRGFCELRNSNPKTARAWALKTQALKTQAMFLWDYTYEASARKHFTWWYRWATHSQLPPMVDKARMLKNHLPNILTYLRLGITNAMRESLNAKVQWVKWWVESWLRALAEVRAPCSSGIFFRSQACRTIHEMMAFLA